jgi:SAM-dependent methyltransferase
MSGTFSRLRNAGAFFVQHGITGFTRELWHQSVNCYHEFRLGIDTTGRVELKTIGVRQQDARDSMPIGYGALFAALKRIPLPKSDVTFLDFGVGKGRAICAAATLPFKQIVGVELSEALVQVARANIDRMRYRKAQRVDVRQGDAVEFDLPRDANLIYFFNPFAGQTLSRVVSNIDRSYREFPRKIYVIFFNNDHFDKEVENKGWIKKMSQTTFYPRISCGVYETVAE